MATAVQSNTQVPNVSGSQQQQGQLDPSDIGNIKNIFLLLMMVIGVVPNGPDQEVLQSILSKIQDMEASADAEQGYIKELLEKLDKLSKGKDLVDKQAEIDKLESQISAAQIDLSQQYNDIQTQGQVTLLPVQNAVQAQSSIAANMLRFMVNMLHGITLSK